ncbi:MAG: hypothetical protein ACFFE8_11675 [Candidatus Heimdallarchaeota archaeon]
MEKRPTFFRNSYFPEIRWWYINLHANQEETRDIIVPKLLAIDRTQKKPGLT